ncbi:MAG TPA: diacylglycerol kinase family lipid kinase [Propionicimonas sp.]|jgi:YegS/Rv2252/BmrU family lipid kinase|nr:diacylglycerol kinase family lipid kinase [Propionicimonas sp.]
MTPWAIVLNPSKFSDPGQARERVEAVCGANGWEPPRWYETSVDDPGLGQARQAVADGALLVCPMGGDGTVRAVVSGVLAGETDGTATVSVGLLPAGTGNLFARNLLLPVDDLEAALRTALTGTDRTVDVGLISLDAGEPEIFLVMAGMGLDADAVAGASTELKRRIGWLAYAWSGLAALVRVGFPVRVEAPGARVASQHAATVMIGNCGEVTLGLRLMPNAEVDDGRLDAVMVSPRSLTGWFAVALHVLSGHRLSHGALVQVAGERIEVTARQPVETQVDGETTGPRQRLTCTVAPGALRVRVPAGATAAN